jgi:serine protein kinase
VNEEIKIYEKLLSHGDTNNIHVAPHTLKVAAMFAILSRLEDPKDKNLDKIKKMKLYNNEDVEGVSKADIPRLKRETQTEGMDGISPRYIINRLVTTAIRGADDGKSRRYITPIDVLRALKDGMETTSKLKPEEKSRYEELLGLAKTEFDHIARNEVQKAFFVSFQDEAQHLMENYIDNVESYLDGSKLKDPITQEEIEPDEKLMRSIEGKIGIHEESKESFRNEVMRKVAAATRRKEPFKYENHTRLREAIEKQMFEERRDTIKMTITSRTKEPEELKRINQVVKTLCERHGYIEESANELLKYVSSMMAREK